MLHWIYVPHLLIHSYVDGYLDLFDVLAFVNSAAKNTWVYVSFWIMVFSGYMLEKEMATHSSILAWRIPWTEEPGGLLSMGLHRVGHNWSDLACIHAWEKEMATHSSILAWRIPGTEEPGGLPSMGSHRVRHNWSDLTAAAAAAVCMDVKVGL